LLDSNIIIKPDYPEARSGIQQFPREEHTFGLPRKAGENRPHQRTSSFDFPEARRPEISSGFAPGLFVVDHNC
jgi:hypothetical protein